MNIFFNIWEKDGFEINDGCIAIGIARMYYEQGFPLAASAAWAKENDLEISWLNVADQFLKAGFSVERIMTEFRALSDFHPEAVDLEKIRLFCELDRETQKEMLWEFWGSRLLPQPMSGLGKRGAEWLPKGMAVSG